MRLWRVLVLTSAMFLLHRCNAQTGWSQQCSGLVLPTTLVEFLPGSVSCHATTNGVSTGSGREASGTVRRAVQLGVHCNGNNGQRAEFFGDLFFDCDDPYHEYANMSPVGSTTVNASRFTCLKSVSFLNVSQSSMTKTMPRVSMSTDDGWKVDSDSCVTFGPLPPSTPLPVVAVSEPTTAPAVPTQSSLTLIPATSVPTSAPSPWSANSRMPTSSPRQRTAVPAIVPMAEVVRMNGTSRPEFAVGAAIGGAMVVIVVAGLVVWAILRRSLGAAVDKPDEDANSQRPGSSTTKSARQTDSSSSATLVAATAASSSSQLLCEDPAKPVLPKTPPAQKSTLPIPAIVREDPHGLDYKDQVRFVPFPPVQPFMNDSASFDETPAEYAMVTAVTLSSAEDARLRSDGDERTRPPIDP
jgi:hypothetical protein